MIAALGVSMRPWVITAGLAAFTATAPVAAQGLIPLDPVTESPGESGNEAGAQQLSFQPDAYERMTVPVQIAGQGPYRFLVDTAADRTSISHELATKLMLKRGGTTRLHSIAGMTSVGTAIIPLLELSRVRIELIHAPMLDRARIGADGILGVDSLRSQRVSFDFKANTLTIVPGASRLVAEDEGTIVVRAKRRNGRLLLSRASADGISLTIVPDTGSQVSMGNEALRRALERRGPIRTVGGMQLTGVTGATLGGHSVLINRLEIGGIVLNNLEIAFANVRTFDQLKLNQRPALLLGMNAIGAFERVSIDFANKKLRLKMPRSASAESAAIR